MSQTLSVANREGKKTEEARTGMINYDMTKVQIKKERGLTSHYTYY